MKIKVLTVSVSAEGRLKFEYNDGIGTGAVQIEANDKGVSFRDLYIGIKDPGRNAVS